MKTANKSVQVCIDLYENNEIPGSRPDVSVVCAMKFTCLTPLYVKTSAMGPKYTLNVALCVG